MLKTETFQNNQIVYISFLSALAITLFVVENYIPKPLPFIKIGLANSILLLLIFQRKYLFSIIAGLAKVFIGNLLTGTLLTPGFLMSAFGTFFSLLVMILFFYIHVGFGIIGISILGAVVHNITQLIVVRWTLINNDSIFLLIPLLLILGLVSGIISGYFAYYLKGIFQYEVINKK